MTSINAACNYAISFSPCALLKRSGNWYATGMSYFGSWLSAMFATWFQKMAAGASVLLTIGGIIAVSLRWEWWMVTSFWAAAAFCFAAASYAVWKEEYKKRVRLEAKILGFPRLRLTSNAVSVVDVLYRTLHVSNSEQSSTQLIFPALRLRLVNEPIENTPDSEANGVRASISFLNPITGEKLLAIDGRWADTTQLSMMDVNRDITEILAVKFPIGQARSLDILIKHKEDEESPYVNCTVTIDIANDGVGGLLRPLKWDLHDDIVMPHADRYYSRDRLSPESTIHEN